MGFIRLERSSGPRAHGDQHVRRAFLNIALFGEDTYGVPLGPDPVPYQIVWILHTHEERCERLTLDEFWGRIIGTTRRGDAGGGYEDG